MPLLFSAALLVSAALLFWVQLFTAKLFLPVLGGSAAVWNTAMMFFQIALLGGYLYAHLLSRYVPLRLQGAIQVLLLAIAGAALPIALHAGNLPPPGGNPIPWFLSSLLVTAGAPFVVLAATAPLLQNWYARSSFRGADDPYFLYAASNVGSLASLIIYPTLIEPRLRVVAQSADWTIGYGLIIALTAACAIGAALRKARAAPQVSAQASTIGVRYPDRLRWICLALVPSSLLLSVTHYLTTDVAAAPLFWVVPLALYLLTFIVAFQRLSILPERFAAALQPIVLLPLAVFLLFDVSDTPSVVFPMHLAAFAVTAFLCHQALARVRPAAEHLTEYYLLISFGGALGGILSALVAPLLFNHVIEYPLGIIAACLLRPGAWPTRQTWRSGIADIVLPACLLGGMLIVPLLKRTAFPQLDDNAILGIALLTVLVAYAFRHRPLRFTLGVAAILGASLFVPGGESTLLRLRNFYGVLRVVEETDPPVRVLYNGTTTHGQQALDPTRKLQPMGYYHPDGPLGHVFAAFGGTATTQRVAAIGLGTGAVACYAHAGEDWTFFEINPAVVAVATDPEFFTFVTECPSRPRIVLGDARLSLSAATDQPYGMIILDAFSSDAIPVHLLTREAIELYLTKLQPGGILIFHISNRYLDLEPVLANLTQDLKLSALGWFDDRKGQETADGQVDIRDASDWVVVARAPEDLAALGRNGQWRHLTPDPRVGLWRDDYSNLFTILTK